MVHEYMYRSIFYQVGKGLSPHELREHVRRIVIQIDEGRENSLSMPEVESIVATMVEQRLNEEKLANQNRWLEEQEAAKNEVGISFLAVVMVVFGCLYALNLC